MTNSKQFRLNRQDGLKILKGAGIAGGGAVIAYLISIVGDINFGTNTALVVAVASIFLNAALKWFKNN